VTDSGREMIAIGRGDLFIVSDKQTAVITSANPKITARLKADTGMRFLREWSLSGKTFAQFSAPADSIGWPVAFTSQ